MELKKTDRKGPLCLLMASVFWSLGGVCIKFIPWSAMSIILLRAVFAIGVFAIYRKSFRIKLTKGNILAAVCQSGTTIMYVFANQKTTAAAAVLLQFTAPVFILLMQLALYKKKPKPAEILAVVMTIAGMLLFFGDALGRSGMIGNILAICSGLSFAGVFVFNKRKDVEPEQSTMLGFYINAIIAAPFMLLNNTLTPDPRAWILVSLLGIVQVGLAYLVFAIGIKKTPALLACLITALEPILNPLWVALATPERPGRFAIAGGIIIVVTIVSYNIYEEVKNNGKIG